jgi:class 3 adenylate cyclase
MLAVEHAGWMVGPLLPSLAGTAGFAVAALGRAGLADRRRQTLRAALGSGAPELTGPRTDSWLALEGARKHLAVMCVRVDLGAGSGRLTPEQVVSRTRRALGEVSRVVATHGGRVEAVGGESVLSIFGDPLPTSGHVRSALGAALDARQALSELAAPALVVEGSLSFSVGVAAGEAVVGDVGGREGELAYRVLGPVVDEAWRLCRSAPDGGVRVNGTVQLAAALDGKPCRPVAGVPDAFDLERPAAG